jgi:hypothetical protein
LVKKCLPPGSAARKNRPEDAACGGQAATKKNGDMKAAAETVLAFVAVER